MLRNTSSIQGYVIAASDGQLGTVSDFLFDDATWLVRWLVVDTGTWLSSRKVLLPSSVLGHIDENGRQFSVNLTMQQVKDSPDIETDRPVSRQVEATLYDYYGWSPYWGSAFYMGGYGYLGGPMVASPGEEAEMRREEFVDRRRVVEDPHLRSVEAVTGYHIHATDGEVGHVDDFLVEDADWSIHFLVVDTKNWWPGKSVLVSPRSARKIDWATRLVNLDVSRETVRNSPTYDPSTFVDRAYERQYHSYYTERTNRF